MIEKLERETLSPCAAFSDSVRGRELPDPSCEIRTEYQRDRDRILHCKSFRRLMNKTQVFLAPEGDHYRTRLTHTLEVCQIARTIARGLRLNEDLAEAIALGHDLGHTPFGHAVEDVLSKVCPHGFAHSEQSVRVVDVIEELNLTEEVRDGIRNHSSGKNAFTLEGQVVRFADKIAYMNHDIEDAIRAGVIEAGDIPFDVQIEIGRTKSQRITTFVISLISHSGDTVKMDARHQELFDELRAFMFSNVYIGTSAKKEEKKAKIVVKRLYEYYTENPDKLSPEYLAIMEKTDVHRAVCDYISGMSDRFCIAMYQNLFVPKGFSL